MVKQIEICDELGQNFIDFSYEANSARAFADARDGLKPGQRACLWEMYSKGYLSNKPHVKSAKIAGSVTGTWWPHGDAAIYETFARMSQPWINNIPEVDWHGNNGSQYSGPECASSRYTEARLSKASEDGLFQGIKKKNVNMILNYSEDNEWPEVLPAVLPRLLVNGCQGIGSTIANVWLPHSLTEVAQVLIKYIDTGKVDYSNLYPSFPTGGIIINKDDIHIIYETGKGKVVLRGKTEIKDSKILITELPYQIYAQPYVEELIEMAAKDEIDGIEAVYNKSGKDKLLIEIECSTDPEYVLKQLFLKTNLQKNYNANQWALVSKTPKLLTLADYCEIYVNHNLDCLRREATFDITKAQDRLNIVKGLLIALEDIDNIITKIKTSENAAAAKNRLMNDYNMNELQAKAVLDMKLSKLAKLEKVEVQKEQEELISTIENLNNFLTHKEYQVEELKKRLNTLVQKYGDDRRTELTQIDTKKEKKEKVIISKDCVVLITQDNMIKRVDKIDYKSKKRKTKGIKNNGEIIKQSINTHTLDTLTVFSSLGKIYKIAVNDIPEQNTNIFDLIKFAQDDVPVAYVSLNEDSNKSYIIFATRNGIIKKTLLSEFETVVRNRTTAIALYDDDILVDATLVDKEPILIITKKGYISMINNAEFAIMTRTAKGTRGIALTADDYVMRVLSVPPKICYVVLITENNKGKKISISDFNPQKKGGKGTPCSKELLAGAAIIEEFDPILVCGETSSLVLDGDEFPTTTRTSPGVMITKNNMKILSLNAI